MTVISTDGQGTEQVGRNVATQLTTVTQILKDLVGIDLGDIVTGRVTGQAIGEGLAQAPAASPRRSAKKDAEPGA
jgi:flotillin